MVDAACTALATGIITKYSTINSGHACDFNYMVYIAGDKVVSEKRECGGWEVLVGRSDYELEGEEEQSGAVETAVGRQSHVSQRSEGI